MNPAKPARLREDSVLMRRIRKPPAGKDRYDELIMTMRIVRSGNYSSQPCWWWRRCAVPPIDLKKSGILSPQKRYFPTGFIDRSE